MYFKNFPFALQAIFSLQNLEADNFFQPTTACEQFFFTKKVTTPPPPDKNNRPSLSVGEMADFEILTLCISLNSRQIDAHFARTLMVTFYCLYLVKIRFGTVICS